MNYLLSLLTGVLISVMVICNGDLSTGVGMYSSSIIIHFVGLLGITFLLLVKRMKLVGLRNIPFWVYSGGLIGILSVLFSNYSVPTLGVSLSVAISLFGQSIASILIDHYGFFSVPVNRFQPKKLIGFAIIFLGIVLMMFA